MLPYRQFRGASATRPGGPSSHRRKHAILIPAADSELKLAKYELLGELGHGGMATVYRARDRRLGRDVAIKVIHRHLRENPEVAKRFASEALAVAKLKHPNIVEVYDVSADDESERYLVVEFVEGVTLRQRLREAGPFPPEIAAAITREVCDALGQAHRNGVVHRDVKPENVLLKLDGGSDGAHAMARVKLTDFGIAKLLDAQGVTHTGQVLGSPAHMAPEQIEGGDVDARADVFGAGVLLYEMLTGSLPFEGQNPAQVLRRVLDGTFLPAERVRPLVGAGYGRIVARALAREPADRFQSAQAFVAALEVELAAVGITDPRAEISRFLLDPEGYAKHHKQHIVERISARGAEARDSGDVMQAAACFNRALAYRPDDTELLAEVAGLARRGRLRRRAARGLAALLLLATSGAVVYLGLSALTQPRLVIGKPKAPVSRPKDKPVGPLLPQGRPAQVAEAPVVAPPKEPMSTVPHRPQLAKPARAVPEGVRLVRTPVVGPQNARVRIDGQLEPWFQVHSLSFGPHTFEFVPPNSDCCEAPPPMTIDVVPGEDAQIVRGVIQFKAATLRLSAPGGSHASCGLGEVIAAGSSQTIPMDRPARDLTCTVVPPSGSSDPPKRVDVGLRPGRTFTLTWP